MGCSWRYLEVVDSHGRIWDGEKRGRVEREIHILAHENGIGLLQNVSEAALKFLKFLIYTASFIVKKEKCELCLTLPFLAQTFHGLQ